MAVGEVPDEGGSYPLENLPCPIALVPTYTLMYLSMVME